MKTGVIYKITSPSGRIYIGKTTRVNDRISCYRNNQTEGQKLLDASIKKYGWETHIFEILLEAPQEQLSDLEIKLIAEYNSFHYDNPMGMNLTRGGEGLLGRKHSKETIDKMIAKRTGTKRSEKTKKLMSSIKIGKAPACTQNPKTEYFLQRVKEANLGRQKTLEEIELMKQTKLNNFLEKYGSVLQIDVTTGNIVKEWFILPKDIAKELKIDDVAIYRSLKGKKDNTKKGFKWRYKKSWDQNS